MTSQVNTAGGKKVRPAAGAAGWEEEEEPSEKRTLRLDADANTLRNFFKFQTFDQLLQR
jgi:hypothetical protein